MPAVPDAPELTDIPAVPEVADELDEPGEPASVPPGGVVMDSGCPAVAAASWMSVACEKTSLHTEGRSMQRSSMPGEVTPITKPAAS